MKESGQKRVVGLLGVGFDNEDGHIRITQGESYKVMMGSGGTHQTLQKLCQEIEDAVKNSGRPLDDYSAEELMEMIKKLY
ncbi:MAG: hypothetical protein PWQ29_865 [Verrucomicrobiota bacterium]|jgi:exopolyphosphatase/pppGpp-phosphohydrolase|nr:hypothetical protein [Verrucomicrobiota bacterium]MDK2963471.1 hypothetical protein [Verrucomicrobiota bacterium]